VLSRGVLAQYQVQPGRNFFGAFTGKQAIERLPTQKPSPFSNRVSDKNPGTLSGPLRCSSPDPYRITIPAEECPGLEPELSTVRVQGRQIRSHSLTPGRTSAWRPFSRMIA
jgi:hypothetical protein